MTKPKSPWILGMLYINADDPRLFVLTPYKLGWAMNFGNPRAATALSWISAIFVLGLFTIPIALHPSILQGPTPWIWLLAYLASIMLIRMNACFTWSDYRHIPLASYGLAAASVGFGAQMIVNGPLVLWWGKDQLSWAHYLILGPVCAVAQTFGKVAAVWLLLKIMPAGSPRICARHGLLVGLGFTLTEIAFLYFPAAWRQIPLGYLSLWERISVSGFHIYSAGLAALALALGRRGLWLILFVVAIHSLMDSIAPAGMSLGWPLYGLEAFVSALAVMTWGVFLFAARPEFLRRQWGFSEEETTDAK